MIICSGELLGVENKVLKIVGLMAFNGINFAYKSFYNSKGEYL
jgi:hypothetical protein